jgi:hypothetical protein
LANFPFDLDLFGWPKRDVGASSLRFFTVSPLLGGAIKAKIFYLICFE